MPTRKIPVIAGMDNAREDEALERGGDNPSLHVRDALNLDISDTGRISMRQGMSLQTEKPFKWLWQSSLHGDSFASLQGDWVKVDPQSWTHEILIAGAGQGQLKHIVLNNQVLMCSDSGLFSYDGRKAQRFTLDTPPAPYVSIDQSGSLHEGQYSFAVSWLRNGAESGLSEISAVQCTGQGNALVAFPLCVDQSISHVRLYASEAGGGELRRVEDYPISTDHVQIPLLSALGHATTTQYLDPIPQGKYLNLWRGRLITVRANVLYFSQALAFHLCDMRYSFIQLPQRITFAEPVDGGIWVGQTDHTVFLRGADLDQLIIEPKASARPVPDSSFIADNALLDGIGSGGSSTAVWLSEKGFVAGTADGQLLELHKGILKNISAHSCTAVGLEGRVTAVVN